MGQSHGGQLRMTKRNRKKCQPWSWRCMLAGAWVVFCSLCLSADVLADDVGRGGYAGSYLRMGLGARAMSMGGGSSALADDGVAAYYNPAGLVFLDGRWFTSMVNSMALDRRMTYLGYAQAIKGHKDGLLRAGLSLGWLCAGVSDIDARDFSGRDIGTLSAYEHGFFFSFALNPVKRIAVGLTGKLLYHRFPELTDDGKALSAVGLGFDFGILIRPLSSLTVGFVLKDAGSKVTWDSQSLYERGTQTVDRFPGVFCFGASLRLLSNRLITTMDIEKMDFFPLRYKGGVQMEVVTGAFLRGGVNTGEFTFGAGYRHALGRRFVQMDYGYVPDDVAPRGNHVFSWSFIF